MKPFFINLLKSLATILFIIGVTTSSFGQITFSENASQNLDQIIQVLQIDQRANKIWWNSWLGLYATGTIVQTGIAITTENKVLKQDMYLGAATTLLGTTFQLITPIVKIDKQDFNLNSELSEYEEREMLLRAQKLLEQSAAFAQEGRSWKMHALTGLVNVGGGLITWLAFDRTLKDGLINFAINTVVTEVQIWTQPIIAQKAYQQYQEAKLIGNYIPKPEQTFSVSASASASGFHVNITF